MVGLLLRFAAAERAIRTGDWKLPDSELYEGYARTIFEGTFYSIGGDAAQRTPGYPLFMATCWFLAGGESVRAVLWAQAVLSTLICWMAYQAGRAVEERHPAGGLAVVALLLTVLEPYSIILSGFVLSETLFTFLMMAVVLLANRPNAASGFLIGIFTGFALLVRPSALLLVPIASVLWFLCSREKRIILQTLCTAWLAMLVVLSPWWIRNARQLGEFIPTTLNVGISLYDGLNPNATGGSDYSFTNDPTLRVLDGSDRAIIDPDRMRELEKTGQPVELRDLTESERDRVWRSRAVRFTRQNSQAVFRLAVKKFLRYWSPWPNADQFQNRWITLATGLAVVPVWIAVVIGIGSLRRQLCVLLLGLVPAVYFCGVHLVFVSSVRYRVPAMPLFNIVAAAGVIAAWRTTREKIRA